jgi:oligosaccharide repeat unit polymerase
MNIVLSCVNAIFSGGRAVIIGYIFAFILMAYFIYKAKYNWKKKVPAMIILFLFFAALMIVPVFYISAFLMGRGKQTDIFHYMCIYLSGEIKNLDVFVRRGIFGTDISNSQTLVSLRRTVLPSFGITGWNSKLELPFINVNGFSTGNVYTIFYMFLYDGGFAALVFYTVLMALLMSLSFRYVINERFRKYYSTINIPLIIYAQLSYAILFSFFSDKFYELIFDLAIWRKNLIILLFVWFITRFKLPASDETAVIIRTRKYVFRKSIYVLRDNKNAS